jgi:hypothetical protein
MTFVPLKRFVQVVWIGALLTGCIQSLFGAGTSNAVPEVFPLRTLDWLPSPVPAALRPVTFPVGWPVDRIEHLVVAGGRLWIAARKRGAGDVAAVQLWSLSTQDGRLDPVRGRIENHTIRDLRAGLDGVWLALDGGAAVLNPRTLIVDPFSAGEGLTTGNGASFGYAGHRWFMISDAGILFSMHADGRSWSRQPGLPGLNPRRAARFESMAGSGEWLLAMASDELTVRHHAAPQWEPVDEKQWRFLPAPQPPRWKCLVEDGDGGFWLGSDVGLHFITAETGSMEHHVVVRPVTVPGGLGVQVPPGYQPTRAAGVAARLRQADGIRERMRIRARLGRLSVEAGRKLDPVTPTSRLPGAVTALVRDGAFSWVACSEPNHPNRSRILLWHGPSRRWVGHVGLALPVSCLAVDESRLWVGANLAELPLAAPILALEKRGLMATPTVKWVPDEISETELGQKLADLPVRERAVHAFFAGDAQKVVDVLEPGVPDAESLFLLAFAHDSFGLNQPARREALVERLLKDFPESPHADVVRTLRPPAAVASAPESRPAAVPALEALFKRRDTDGDGRISLSEWKEWKGDAADMGPFDKDKNGSIGLDEFDAVLRGGLQINQ